MLAPTAHFSVLLIEANKSCAFLFEEISLECTHVRCVFHVNFMANRTPRCLQKAMKSQLGGIGQLKLSSENLHSNNKMYL